VGASDGGGRARPGAAKGSWRRSPVSTFWLLCVASSATFIAQGLLYPALPLYLTEELGTSNAVAGLVVSSVAVAAVASRPWAGATVDRRGRRPLLLVGPLIIAVTMVGLLVVHSVWMVLVSRLLQGVGNGFAYTAASAVAADVAPEDRRARYLARFSLFFYVGFAVGPFLAEVLISGPGFQAVWLTVAGCCLLGTLVALAIPETRSGPRSAGPLPPLLSRIFHPAAIEPGLVFFCVSMGWTAVSAFLALYARDIGLSGSQGLFIILSATVLLTRPVAGRMADQIGRFAVAIPSAVAVSAGLAILAAFPRPVPAGVGLIIFGAGFSGLFPALLTLVVDRAPPAERGTAMSSFNVYFDVGAPIGGYGTGQLVDWGGFGLGFGTMAGLAAFGGVLLIRLARQSGPKPRPVVRGPLGARRSRQR
jgi:MFS family permease